MDVLEGGSDQSGRLAALARRVPAGVVAVAVAVSLAAGLLGVEQVRRDERALSDVSAVELRLVIERTRRAGDGSAYGFVRLEVVDPAGRAVQLQAVDVDVAGLRLGFRGVAVRDVEPAARVALPLRFAVPDCAELTLPGRLRARVARPGRPADVVSAQVVDGAPGAAGATAAALRGACGQPPPG